jgi:hypothetical protein
VPELLEDATLGLLVPRPHEADGNALTTRAQVFLAPAAYLDQFSRQTVGSMERLSRRTSNRVPLRRALRRLRKRLLASSAGSSPAAGRTNR